MKLYGYWRSSSAWRVRIGVNLKGIAVTHVPVHLVQDGGQQHSESHRARNPQRQVPVLELDDGTAISQSLAILDYLEQIAPTPRLWPDAPVARARAVQLAELVNSGIQPLQNLAVLLKLDALGVDRLAWGRDAIAQGFDAMERLASASAGAFLVGDAVSIADVCLVPQLYNARRFKVELAPYPTLLRVEQACAALPAFAAAHPDAQPDAPAAD